MLYVGGKNNWIVSFLFVYVTRSVFLANCSNMASLVDNFYYKLLDEVKYVAFGFMTRIKDSTESCHGLQEPHLEHLFKSVVHSGGCAVSK